MYDVCTVIVLGIADYFEHLNPALRTDKFSDKNFLQKGNSQNGCFKKIKPNFPKNEHFLSPDTHTCMCAYQGVRGVRNLCFSENLARFGFFKHPF